MKTIAWVVEVLPEKMAEYTKLHANPWPAVVDMIKKCNIGHYSIFLRKFDNGKYYLFSYLEYTGRNFGADMAMMGADETIQKWWDVCKPCLKPFDGVDCWADMEEVFRVD